MRAKFIVSELGTDTDSRDTMTLSTTSRSGLSTTVFSIGLLKRHTRPQGGTGLPAVTAEIKALIDRLARAAFDGNAAWFLGAGISRPSNLVSWPELLRRLACELNLTLDDHDDLPAIAHNYINKASGNRGRRRPIVPRRCGGKAAAVGSEPRVGIPTEPCRLRRAFRFPNTRPSAVHIAVW
jgi:hypothetical protein